MEGLQEENGYQVDEQEVETELDTTTDNDESSDVDRDESARETVARVIEEERQKLSDGGEGEAEASIEEKPESPAEQKRRDGREWDPELQPPERLKVEHKETFNRLPKGMKREVHRMFREHEAHFTRSQQQLNQELSQRAAEYDDIDRAVRPFVADWARMGISRSSGIAELCGVNAKLQDPKDEVREETLAWLVQNCRVDPSRLYSKLTGQSTPSGDVPDISHHPRVRQLEETLSRLQAEIAPVHSHYQQSVAEQQQQIIGNITAEMSAVQHEKDAASGRYLYPELHDDVFLESVKQRVSDLVRTGEVRSYGEALKLSVLEKRLRQSPSTALPQTRIPASTNNHNSKRALSAAVSVRGKSATSSSGVSGMDAPPEALATTRDTVRWAIEQERRKLR